MFCTISYRTVHKLRISLLLLSIDSPPPPAEKEKRRLRQVQGGEGHEARAEYPRGEPEPPGLDDVSAGRGADEVAQVEGELPHAWKKGITVSLGPRELHHAKKNQKQQPHPKQQQQ